MIPPTAVLLRSFLTTQNFGFGVPPALRMTHRDFIGYQFLIVICYYGFDVVPKIKNEAETAPFNLSDI